MGFSWRRLGTALAAGFRAATARSPRKRPANPWLEFADETGLTYVGSPDEAERLEGRIGAHAISVEKTTRANPPFSESVTTRWEVDARGRVPSDVTLERESTVATALGFADIRTGDAAFDAVARVGGRSLAATALLGALARRTVAAALARGITLEKAVLRRTTDGRPASASELRAGIDELAALADALAMSETDIPRRLLENVLSDPVTAVRGRSLGALLSFYPGSSETAAAARKAIDDPSPGMRVAGAEALPGAIGFETLVAVATGENEPEDQRARAIAALVARDDPAASAAAIERLLDAGPETVRRAAVLAVGRLRHAAALPRLVALARGPALEPGVAEAVAIALGEIGHPSGERAAIDLLAAGDERVVAAAARALGEIGGRDAVLPLRALSKRLLPLGAVRSSALAAIRSIQERLGPQPRGGLSVADGSAAEGALSEPADAGRLAIPEESDPDAPRDDD